MRVLIADDHALFRDGLSLHLEQIDPHAIILQAGTFSQAMKILDDEKKVDLILVDLDMPDQDWHDALSSLKEKAGEAARFVIISASEDPRNIRKALEYGISGYITKRSDTKVLIGALRLILDGGTYLPPALLENNKFSATPAVQDHTGKGKNLTSRQAQVLSLVAQGLSNKQIAYEIGVSEATVKLHINALLRAMGVTNRTQAVITAQKMGII